MLVSKMERTIEWGDCDPAGIVFYPRYFAYFDASTGNMFNVAGFPKFEMLKKFNAIGFPMVDTRAKFYIPSRFGEVVTIESTISEFRRSSFDVHHRLLKGDKLSVECFETRVWVGADPENPQGIKSQAIPKEIIQAFESVQS